MNFAHLHVHTEYSLLDGSNKIKEYVARVKELGMTAAAITDHGVMYGVIDFYRAARAAGINPVLGCEVYVAPGSRFDKTAVGRDEDRYYHLVLLAENNTGYANLMKIVSRAFTEGYYYKPRVDYELLETYHEGIIALSACLAGEVQRNLARGMYEEGKKAALHYEQIFGKGNFFLELQDHGIPEQRTVNQQLMRLSQEIGIDLVATNDVHYTYAEDEKPHDILLCLQTGKKLADEDRMRYEGGQYYVKSKEEMAALFPYAPEALENTQKIADRCHVEIEFGVTKLPKFDVPEGFTSWEYLNKLCFDGLKRRYGEDPDPALVERLNYELGVIKSMGYVDYFLIVWDFIHFAKSNGIMVGPGRGSAAGSIVAYTLAITNIDPIRYQLLFERFLNPERVSMPDIDVDFCFERRQEVIDYVVRKYGKDRVVQIVTFGTLQARGVLRDVGRVMDLPYAFVDSIAKMIPKELNITLDKSLKMNHELKKLYDEDPQVKELIDMSKRLEGPSTRSGDAGAGAFGADARPSHEARRACDVNHGSLHGKGEIDGKRQGKRRRRGRSEARRGAQANHGAPRGGREGRLRVGKVSPLPCRHVAIPQLQRQQLPAHRDATPGRDAGSGLSGLARQVRQAGEEGRARHEDPQPGRGQGERGGRRRRRSARRQRRGWTQAQARRLPPGHRVRREPDRGKGAAHLGGRRADGRRRPIRGRHARRLGD